MRCFLEIRNEYSKFLSLYLNKKSNIEDHVLVISNLPFGNISDGKAHWEEKGNKTYKPQWNTV